MLGFLRRRRILARLAHGDAHPEDADVRAALEADPKLASLVIAQRTRLAAGHGAITGPPPGSARPRSRAATWTSIVLLLAALAMFVRDLISPPSIEADTATGERRIEFDAEDEATLAVRSPEPMVDDYRTIAFSGALPAGGWFKVELRPADAAPDSAPILERNHLREHAWTPTGEERLALPDAIAITVRVFDSAGTEQASVTHRSRRMR